MSGKISKRKGVGVSRKILKRNSVGVSVKILKRNDVEIYNISKQIKRLQRKVESSNVAILTLVIGFLSNIVSIVLGLLKDEISDTSFLVINIIVICIVLVAVITLVVTMVKKKFVTVVGYSKYDWCTRFDEYVVPNVKCAIELSENLSVVKKTYGVDSAQYKLYITELAYYLSSAARVLKEILTRSPSIIGSLIAKERVETIISLIKTMSSQIDKNKHESMIQDLNVCEGQFKDICDEFDKN